MLVWFRKYLVLDNGRLLWVEGIGSESPSFASMVEEDKWLQEELHAWMLKGVVPGSC